MSEEGNVMNKKSNLSKAIKPIFEHELMARDIIKKLVSVSSPIYLEEIKRIHKLNEPYFKTPQFRTLVDICQAYHENTAIRQMERLQSFDQIKFAFSIRQEMLKNIVPQYYIDARVNFWQELYKHHSFDHTIREIRSLVMNPIADYVVQSASKLAQMIQDQNTYLQSIKDNIHKKTFYYMNNMDILSINVLNQISLLRNCLNQWKGLDFATIHKPYFEKLTRDTGSLIKKNSHTLKGMNKYNGEYINLFYDGGIEDKEFVLIEDRKNQGMDISSVGFQSNLDLRNFIQETIYDSVPKALSKLMEKGGIIQAGPIKPLNEVLNEFKKTIEGTGKIINGFWESKKDNKLVKNPERYAHGHLLHALNLQYKPSNFFSEPEASIGYIDIFVFLDNSEKYVIELKIIRSDSEIEELAGKEQIREYMRHKQVRTGYLIYFDTRYGRKKPLPEFLTFEEGKVFILHIDVNPIPPSKK